MECKYVVRIIPVRLVVAFLHAETEVLPALHLAYLPERHPEPVVFDPDFEHFGKQLLICG